MSKKEKSVAKAEAFVRKVLAKSFKQTVDADTLRAVAEKVSQAVNAGTAKKVAATSKRAA